MREYDTKLAAKAKKRSYHKKKWIQIRRAIYIVFMFCVFFTLKTGMSHATAGEIDTEYPVTIERVVDGDTFVVKQNHKKYKVRLIGVNTPESVAQDESRNTETGIAASDYSKKHLPKGSQVYLEFDKETKDKYGRLLAYVWLTDNCSYDNYQDFCTYNYGAILMQNTYCDAVYYEPNEKYREWYEQLELQYQ